MSTMIQQSVRWPPKFNLFGVHISAVTCDEACDAILSAAEQQEAAVVSAFSVHALMEAAKKSELTKQANGFAMVAPDGQPVRWALNWLHGAALERNLRGSDLMWQLCRRAEAELTPIYLYGGTPETITALVAKLLEAFPALEIAGAESPPFRPLDAEEDAELVRRVNASGARLMFIGLGCPKQDYFAAEHAGRIAAVQLCVGAAFDFLAGTKATAPQWMQRFGLEWLHRLSQEPGRLWKRYLVTNSVFLVRLTAALMQRKSTIPRPHAIGSTTARRQSAIRVDRPGK